MSSIAGDRPRLLVLASTYPRSPDDPEPGFVHLLSGRLAESFDVTVVCPHAAGAATCENMEGVAVVRYRYAPARLETLVNDGGIVTNLRRQPWKWLLVPGFIAGLFFTTWRLCRRLEPDAIHAHWLLPQGLAAALVGGRTPFLVTSHGADLFALRSRPLQALKRFVARRASAMTVVSSAMRDACARLSIDASRIQVEPMGVDLSSRFTPDPGTIRSMDELLFVGRLVEKKGLRHLVDAMPAIVERRPTAFLTVAGFGPELAERKAQVERMGLGHKVNFLGAVRQADLPNLYRRAALLVAPFVEASSGDQEGLGLVAVEAAGCECPVVIGELPATRDVFPDRGSVRFVRGNNAGELSKACLEVLSSPQTSAEMAERARSQLKARFDWSERGAAYAAILATIARGNG